MHILRQLFLVRLGLAVAALFTGVFGTAFAVGIHRLYKSTAWSEHTNRVLEQITLTQQLSERSLALSRVRLLGETVADTALNEQRERVRAAVDVLHAMTADNADQARNIALLRAALERRFDAHDRQFEQMRTDREMIAYTKQAVDESIIASIDVERVFTRINLAEIDLLQARTNETNGLYWIITYTMIVSVVLSIAGGIVARIALFRELKFRQQLARELREKNGINGGGLTAKETATLFRKIEGALT